MSRRISTGKTSTVEYVFSLLGLDDCYITLVAQDIYFFRKSKEQWNGMGGEVFMSHACHERNVLVTMYWPILVPVGCCRCEIELDVARVSRG